MSIPGLQLPSFSAAGAKPATAGFIATKLARRFVADVPPPALVTRLARVYLANDTDIRPVLRELISSREFARSRGKKVRTPVEDVVATWRALGARPAAPMGRENAAANAVISRNPGRRPKKLWTDSGAGAPKRSAKASTVLTTRRPRFDLRAEKTS